MSNTNGSAPYSFVMLCMSTYTCYYGCNIIVINIKTVLCIFYRAQLDLTATLYIAEDNYYGQFIWVHDGLSNYPDIIML